MGIAAPGSKTENPQQSLLLKVATLNYSGILLSPYEFYEETENSQTQQLDDNMKEILSRQFNGTELKKIDFEIGELDKSWQKGRFSPIYEPQCGVKKGSFMMNKKEFEQEWDKYQQKNRQNLKLLYENYTSKKKSKGQQDKILEQNKLLVNCRKFDCMLYEAILKTVYGEQMDLKKFDSDSFHLSSTKYLNHRKIKFSKAFINQKFKIKKTIQAIEKLKIDILFIQEASKEFIQAIQRHLQDFRICKGQRDSICKSAIIIRLQKFPKAQSLVVENTRFLNNITNLKSDFKSNSKQRIVLKDIKKDLNINGDTVIQFIYNIILICPHLTSNQRQKDQNKKGSDIPKKQNDKKNKNEDKKKQDNQVQTVKLNNAIIRLKAAFPDCHIIVGGDLNNEKYEAGTEIKNEELENESQKKLDNKGPKNENKSNAASEEKKSLKDINLPEGYNCQFNVFPSLQLQDKIITSFKKRTFLQAQPNKAEEQISKKKDYIITDLKIDRQNSKVIFFDEQQNPQSIKNSAQLKSYIPTNDHPYDHFMVYAEIQIKDKLEHVTDMKYLQKYEPGRLTSENYRCLMKIKEEEEEKEKKKSPTGGKQ